MASWKGFPRVEEITGNAEIDTLLAFVDALKDVSGPLMGPALLPLSRARCAKTRLSMQRLAMT